MPVVAPVTKTHPWRTISFPTSLASSVAHLGQDPKRAAPETAILKLICINIITIFCKLKTARKRVVFNEGEIIPNELGYTFKADRTLSGSCLVSFIRNYSSIEHKSSHPLKYNLPEAKNSVKLKERATFVNPLNKDFTVCFTKQKDCFCNRLAAFAKL